MPLSAATATSLVTLPAGLFVLTSIYYTRVTRQRCKRRRRALGLGETSGSSNGSSSAHSHYLPPPDDDDNVAIIEEAVNNATDREQRQFSSDLLSLSRRGQRAALPPTRPHWSGFIACLQDPCDALHNPEGYIALCLAENKLVQELLANRLLSSGTAIGAFSDGVVYGYNGFLGLPTARQAVAYLLERRFLFAEGRRARSQRHASSSRNDLRATLRTSNTSSNIDYEEDDDEGGSAVVPRPSSPGPDPDRIDPALCALGAGVASLLSHVLFIICQPHDAILIPAPFYASFENDLQALALCVPWPVHMANPRLGPTVKELEHAALMAEREGLSVRALLLTNPNDPLGVVYRPITMINSVEWARGRGMHTIVDEIYALSVHRPKESEFESIIRLLNNEMHDDVHLLYGLSKDFGASGFRVGFLYTQNTFLLAALSNLNIFSGVSHPVQLILAEILTDDDFLDGFLDDCRATLLWSHAICVQKLEEMVVPYAAAEAGLFVYIDLSALLPEQSWEGERRLARLIEQAARVVLAPGEHMYEKRPGHFRICYSWVTPEVLEIAMERLSFIVKKIRRHGVDVLASDAKSLAEVTKAGMLVGIRRTPSINLAELTHTRR